MNAFSTFYKLFVFTRDCTFYLIKWPLGSFAPASVYRKLIITESVSQSFCLPFAPSVVFCRLKNFLPCNFYMNKMAWRCRYTVSANTSLPASVPLQVPYVKVAPEDILKVQVPRFTTLDLRPTNTDISLAVAGLLTFFNSTTSCLICAQADCKCCVLALTVTVHPSVRTHAPPLLFLLAPACQQSANAFVMADLRRLDKLSTGAARTPRLNSPPGERSRHPRNKGWSAQWSPSS